MMKIMCFDEKENIYYEEMTWEEYKKAVYEQAKRLPLAQTYPKEFERTFEEEGAL